MDWQTIIISFITSCIPAGIAYFSVSKETKFKLEQIEKNNTAELEKMRLEYELKLKEKDNDSQNEFALKFLSGELDLSSVTNQIEHLQNVTTAAQKLSNSSFIKNK